ncbi:hypothetical protein CAI21_16830 [Alkalilimnicola ehrlichii]|uniref:Outer membrane protein beta-barrel domain-containing protein n=1 Tax=Alkalilimnicola ehrlichii TaxID=351052 RepID=A0A3E0WKD8_9GAMM|nr:hypothetical protein [Alkalilimnicola ehrlichii]RFA26357.1 hypothetical protein CAI21_16830 [Alkalilimnicola ehrlichii]RFA33422.1 hypothetical protein CAL65_17315 [Alkalilimnicola ehrlichii]
MFKRSVVVGCIAVLALGGVARVEAGWRVEPEHRVTGGLLVSSFLYEEPNLMEIGGPLLGLRFQYDYRGEAYFFQGNVSYEAGRLDYDGALQDLHSGAIEPHRAKSNDSILSLEARIGEYRNIDMGEVAGYVGVGYRYWDNALRGAGGYRRETHYVYLPLGFSYESYGDSWRFGGGAEYRFFVRGWNDSRLSDVRSDYEDVSFKLGGGMGTRLYLRAVRVLDGRDNRRLLIEPYFDYWDIEESSVEDIVEAGHVIAQAVEPHNQTRQIGVAISIDLF